MRLSYIGLIFSMTLAHPGHQAWAGDNSCSTILAALADVRPPWKRTTSNEEEAFLVAITAKPGDETARLVYADWLEEHDRAASAEVVRLEIEHQRVKYEADEKSQERTREIATRLDTIRRGAIAEWNQSPYGRDFAKIGSIESLSHEGLPVLRPKDRKALLEAPPEQVGEILGLDLMRQSWSTLDIQRLMLQRPRRLVYLNLSMNPLVETAIETLASSPDLQSLSSLYLLNCGLTASCMRPLAGFHSRLGNLTHLNLGANNVGNLGVERLARTPTLEKLTDLNLADNGITGVRLLAYGNLKNLRSLSLAGNGVFAADGVQDLTGATSFTNLRDLQLNRTALDAKAAAALARSTTLEHLVVLNVGQNRLGNDGVLAIVDEKSKLTKLRVLQYDNNNVTAPLVASVVKKFLDRNGSSSEGN